MGGVSWNSDPSRNETTVLGKNQESTMGMGREATSKPAPFANGAKGCGTRKIKSRAKTSQLQDALPEWVHRERGVINEGNPAAAGEKAGHPPFALIDGHRLSVFLRPA
jgi:hypothetical protein